MRLFMLTLSILATLVWTGTSQAQDDRLDTVIDAHWAHTLKRNPVFATTLGVRDYDDRLGSVALKTMDEDKEVYEGLLQDLASVNVKKLSPAAKLDYDLLELDLKNAVASLSFPQRQMLFTRFYGWHIEFAGLPDRQPFFTQADYESYIARLLDYARLNGEGIATTRMAIANGMMWPCEALVGYESTISGQIVAQPENSVFFQPFKKRPNGISIDAWRALRSAGRAAIADIVIPAYRQWLSIYADEYLPRCVERPGINRLARGDDYYTHQVKVMTTTKLVPREIHQIGLAEVSRIRREMRAVMDQVKFDGSFEDFQAYLRTDPRFYAKTGEELLHKTAFIAKKADGELPKLFGHLPRMTYTVKPIPAELAPGNTTAYYEAPAGDGSRAGVYRVNLSSLDQRPLFELEALTLHEAVPGHHLQIAIQQELDMPNFRKYGGFTAFAEGWGLYAERLGLDMGFYEDPYSNFGRLSYEMWRACRLVVDTGLHSMGWSRDQAILFMQDNTALSETNITSEVDRYITWPGQALAYKLGELKFRELRKLSQETLGPAFDLRAFHDMALEAGALPLTILEERTRTWIKANGGVLPEPRKGKRPDEERGDRRQQRRN